MLASFKLAENLFSPMQNIIWQPGKPRHMHPIGSVGRPGNDFMQKHDTALPLAHLNRMAMKPIKDRV